MSAGLYIIQNKRKHTRFPDRRAEEKKAKRENVKVDPCLGNVKAPKESSDP